MNAPAKFASLAAAALLVACNNTPQDSQRVREDTARTTATIKNDVKAAADGIRDGLHSDTPASDRVNINTADKPTLETLPGVTSTVADRIIAHRPYSDTADLTSKHIVSQDEYDRLSSHITTTK